MELPKVLQIDLISKKSNVETLPIQVVKKYLGGKGLATYLLAKKLRPERLDPLSPDNVIVLGAVPLASSEFPCGAGYVISTVSPLTQSIYHFYGNGFLSLYLKGLGYDYLVLTGSSNRPAYLLVQPNAQVLFFSGKSIWESSPADSLRILQKDYPESHISAVGLAGVNMVSFATFFPDAAHPKFVARGGLGAVFGSKNLKALVFSKPAQMPPPPAPGIRHYITQYRQGIDRLVVPPEQPQKTFFKRYLRYADITEVFAENYHHLYTEEEILKWLEGIFKYSQVLPASVPLCPTRFSLSYQIPAGQRYSGETGSMPGFEDIYALGINLGLNEPGDYFHLNQLCYDLGLDPIEMGFTLGTAVDGFIQKHLDESETKEKLEWGKVDLFERLILQTAKKESFGQKLSLGLYGLLRRFPHSGLTNCVHLVKRQGIRYTTNHILSLFHLVTSCVDVHRDLPYPIFQPNYRRLCETLFHREPTPQELDFRQPEGKGKIVWWTENYLTILHSLGLCHEPVFAEFRTGDEFSFTVLAEMASIVSGIEFTTEQIQDMAQRILLLQRQINIALSGEQESISFPKQIPEKKEIKLSSMLAEYYPLRGCTPQGIPRSLEMLKFQLDPQHINRC